MFGAGFANNPASQWRHYWTQMLSWSRTGLDDSCYADGKTATWPSTTTTSPPTQSPSSLQGCNVNFEAPSNFGFLIVPWSGDCRTKKCPFQHLAKTQDGNYIAG